MAFINNFGYQISWEKIIFCNAGFKSDLDFYISTQFWKLYGVLNQVENNTLIKLEVSIK